MILANPFQLEVVDILKRRFKSLQLRVAPPDVPADLTSGHLDRLWKAVREATNWWLDLPPYEPEQIARLYTLARRGRWEVFFLTSRPASGMCTRW